jgi:hypothetical protein
LFNSIFGNSKIKKLQEQINSLMSDNGRLIELHQQQKKKLQQENVTLRHENKQNKQKVYDLSQEYLSVVKENNNLISEVRVSNEEQNKILEQKNQLTIKSNKVQEILQQILLDLFARGLVMHTIDDIYQYPRDGNIIFYKIDPLKGFEVVLQVSSTKDVTVLSNDDKYLYFADDSTQSLYPVEKLSETYFRVFRNNKWLVFIKETQNKIIFKEPDNGIYYDGFGCKIVDDSIKGPVRIATNISNNHEFKESPSDYKDMETFTGRVDWHSDWQTEK